MMLADFSLQGTHFDPMNQSASMKGPAAALERSEDT